jgi:hypothetical protein
MENNLVKVARKVIGSDKDFFDGKSVIKIAKKMNIAISNSESKRILDACIDYFLDTEMSPDEAFSFYITERLAS